MHDKYHHIIQNYIQVVGLRGGDNNESKRLYLCFESVRDNSIVNHVTIKRQCGIEGNQKCSRTC